MFWPTSGKYRFNSAVTLLQIDFTVTARPWIVAAFAAALDL